MKSIITSLSLALFAVTINGCAVDSGSTLKTTPYPATSGQVAVFLEPITGTDANSMRQILLEELVNSGAFTLAPDAASAGLRLNANYKETQSSSGGSSGVNIESVGIDLGHQTAKWALKMSVQEISPPSGRNPFLRTVHDEVSTTAVGGGVGYEGENVSSNTAPDTPEVRTARRNVCHQVVYEIIMHLKRQGQL